MNIRQLKRWLTNNLKEAEPLDSISTMEDPRHIALTAAKKLGLLGCGSGELLSRADKITTPIECAAILTDCLALLPSDIEASTDALSVPDVAARLGVSKETVYAMCTDGRMPCTRIGRRVIITPEHLASFESYPSQV